MSDRYDVIVLGAGLIGTAFALSLAEQSSHRIALVERAGPIRDNHSPNARVVALGMVATDLLQQVGVLAELGEQAAFPYTSMFVWDEHSEGELRFTADDLDQPLLGHIVDAIQCNLLLQQQIESQPNIDACYGVRAHSLEFSSDEAVLRADGQCFRAPLIVAADGARSWARQQARIFAHRFEYPQQGVVARIDCEQSHQNTAWQRFLSTGPLAVLPLKDNHASIVWSAEYDRADELMALDDNEFGAALTEAFEGRLGALRPLTKRQTFPLQSMRAEQYVKPRLALIGDAAHSIHPLAGQGANLGFKDLVCLTQLLSNRPAEMLGDFALLRRYERRRRPDNEQTDLMMGMLHRAYQYEGPWWLAMRGRGMNWISGSVPLKNSLARRAMGL